MELTSFKEIFRRELSGTSGHRPAKVELTGVLIPVARRPGPTSFHLETSDCDIDLAIPDWLLGTAQRLSWGEVSVKGVLDTKMSILVVERIRAVHRKGEEVPESLWDFENFKRAIAQCGKLEPALDFLAS